MKKAVSLLLILPLLFLSGCKSEPKTSSPPSSEPTATPSPTPTPEPEFVSVLIGTVYNVSSYLNIRSAPSSSADAVGKANSGDSFIIVKENAADKWHEIEYNGSPAYVHSDYITIKVETVMKTP